MYKLLIFCLLASCAAMKQTDPVPLFDYSGPRNTKRVLFEMHPSYSQFTEKSKSNLSKLVPKYADQGDLNSCGAFAVANAVEFAYTRTHNKFFGSSKLFLYYNAREDKVKDDGTEIEAAIDAAIKYGITTTKYWPYIEQNYKIEPPTIAYETALKYRIDNAYKVKHLDVRKALSNGYPVIISCTIYKQFNNLDEMNHVLPIPSKNEESIGEHAMIIIGHDDKTQLYLVNNSWGIDWGLKGTCYIPYDYIHNKKLTDVCWIIDYVK